MVTEEEWNTRNALLGYYSTQTASHATLLLTIALVGLALGGLRLQKLSFVSALSVVVAAFVRTLMRTLYWGYLASAIIQVDKKLCKEDKDSLKKRGGGSDLDEGYISPELETFRLHIAADTWVHAKRSWATWFGSLADLRGISLTLLALIVAFLCLWYGYGALFEVPN